MKNKYFLKQLRNYKKRAWDWIEFKETKKGKGFNAERNTTVKFIIPLLEMLGWDPLSKNPLSRDVEFEYHLKDKKGGSRSVDIALYPSAKNPKIPKIIIEVKPIARPKPGDMEKPTHQLFRDYLRANKVTYGILTNGMELIVFTGRFVRYDAKRAKTLFRLKLEDFIEFSDVLWLLSKEMIEKENGTFDELMKIFQSGDKYWRSWFFPKRDMIRHKKFHELAKIYKTEEYWKERTGSKELNEYILPLVFAKKFLERETKR